MKKKWLFTALLVPLLLFALSRLDAQSLLHSIRQIPLWLAALLIGLQIVSQLLVNLQWYQIAKFTDADISFGNMFYINCQGAVMDSITPGVKIGGEVTRAVQISRRGNCSGEQAVAVVALQKLFSLSAFFFINLFTVGYLIGRVPLLQIRYMQFLVYGILLFFLLLFAGIFLAPRRIKTYLQTRENSRFSWMRRVRGFLLTLLDQVISIRRNTKALFLLSFFIWLLYPVKLYLLAIQFFPEAPAVYIGAITFASYMVAMIPIFPGGLGGFEGTMSGLLLTMGFEVSDAVVVTVLFRFVTFWFVMLFSLGFIGWCKLVKGTAVS